MLKVLQIVSDKNIGGAGKVVLNLISNIPKDSIGFKVVIPRGSLLKPEIESCGIHVIEVDGIADKSFSAKGLAELIKVFIRERPDIIHTHASLSARIAARLLRIKIVFTRHWRGDIKAGPAARFINNALCDCAIAVSLTAYEALEQLGIERKKIQIVYNGIKKIEKKQPTNLRNKLGINNKLSVGIIARLEEVKNHRCLLLAASEILKSRNDIVFLIAGTGSLEEELKNYAKELGIAPAVRFLGFVKDIAQLYGAIDINVLCSFEEAFPLSILEAMSAGIPSIATVCGGTVEQLDSATGVLIPVDSHIELAKAIITLADSPDMRTQLGSASEAVFESKFTAKAFAEKTISIYKNL